MRAHEVVRNHIEQEILDGDLTVGSLLAPELDLAARFDVSRSAVREALHMLAAQGLVTSKVGTGPASGTRISSNQGPALGNLLQMSVALSQFPIDDVVDTRVMLERFSASLTATRSDKDSIDTLETVLTKMETSRMELEEFNRLDTRFHILIAGIARNELVNLLITSVRQALAGPIKIASQKLADYQEFRRGLNTQHRAIFEAIAAHEPLSAADLVEEHIRTSYRILPMDSPGAPS